MPEYFEAKDCERVEDAERDKHARYRMKHRVGLAVRDAARRAGPAMPSWLTEEQHEEVRRIYAEAYFYELAGHGKHHVDHIVPLNHPDVCGLHVSRNLQILTAAENLSKSNSFDGTQENEGWLDALSPDGVVIEEHYPLDDDNERPF